ncbi:MAG: S9 family peptidase [Steroidobacteraceae bacterium]
MRRLPLVLIALLMSAQSMPAPTPFTPDDLVRVKRLSDPQVAPDGHRVVYTLRTSDMEANKGSTDLWLADTNMPLAAPRKLTTHAAGDASARWSSDGREIYFLSSRSGSSQVWKLALAGGEATQVTDLPLEVGTFAVAPGASGVLAISLEVFTDCADLACTRARLDAKEKSPSQGLVYDRLFIRHWDTWSNGTRAHLFTVHVGADGKASAPVDVMRGMDADTPSKPFGGDEEYTFSPDGKRIVFSTRVAGRTEPWSTNFDLYETGIDGDAAPRNLTAANPAWDTQPVFLKDGTLAYLAMKRPGFESDRFAIMVRKADGSTRELAPDWDRSVARLRADFSGTGLLANADERGQVPLFALEPKSGKVRALTADGQVTDYSPARNGVVIAQANLNAPPDLYLARAADVAPARISDVNRELLAARAPVEYEQFSFEGWNNETVYGYVVKPAGLVAGRKYPVALQIHGGPQVAAGNSWSYRWNPRTLAGSSYAIVMIDFHGTPGYGQAFTDSISQDWGGKPFIDNQKGLTAAIERFDFLDGDKACALGASYGGFMINWIAGQWPERFKCLVNHDGIFDARAMYYTTEELWFEEWEHGGIHYDNPESYEKFNPLNHVKQWRTPMLVVQGEQDFRVPDGQGIATFTALQRLGIDSRLLFFPDENHWVLKPANSLQWHHEVLGWLDKYLK